MEFNPGDVQAVGIGVSAFLSLVITTFFFLSAGDTKLGRSMLYVVAAVTVFACFGFFYHLTGNLALARAFRVVSQMGIVLCLFTQARFAYVYYEELHPASAWMRVLMRASQAAALFFAVILAFDMIGTRLVVGALRAAPSVALAPEAGPLMIVLIMYFVLNVAFTGAMFVARIRQESGTTRRASEYIAAGVVVGMVLAGTRYLPWYGHTVQAFWGGLAYPFFICAAFYAIRKYKILNVQVALAQLVIFALWTFTFFRILLSHSLREAMPDIGLFVAVLILGILLMRSVINELKVQRELAQLTVEKAKSEFVTIAAHQLRTPLAGIRWSLSMLADTELATQQKEMLGKAQRAADTMLELSNDFLNITRSDAGLTYELETADVQPLVEEVADSFEDVAAVRKISLVKRFADSLPPVAFDKQKMRLCVQNLVDNAVKYTPDGGSVTVASDLSGVATSASTSLRNSSARTTRCICGRTARGSASISFVLWWKGKGGVSPSTLTSTREPHLLSLCLLGRGILNIWKKK